MSDVPDYKEAWNHAAASLFRGARGAHDPTALERARLDAVLARIQAGNDSSVVSGAASQAPGAVAGGTTHSSLLRQLSKLSIALVCVGAATFAVMPANRKSSEVPAAPASAGPQAPVATAPESASTVAPRVSPPDALAARDKAEPRARIPRRRTRANASGQDGSRLRVSAPEPPSSTAADAASGSTTTPGDTTQRDRVAQPSAASAPVAAQRIATSLEASARAQTDPTLAVAPPGPSQDQQSRTEIAFVRRMHAALRDADFANALALCAEHARRWPHGVFEFEREGIRAIASCGAEKDDASLQAKRFLAAHPHAPMAMHVSAACAAQLAAR